LKIHGRLNIRQPTEATMPEFNLDEFRGVTRLFPLKGLVMFPHAVVPLHVFEPRYRQMTEDALASDRLITIVQPSLEPIPTPRGPLLEQIGCIGRIIQHERLDDGRFNLLLAGISRIRIVSELQTPGKLYREAEAEIITETHKNWVGLGTIQEMIGRFTSILNHIGDDDASELEIRRVLKTSRDAGLISDLISQAITLPAFVKQTILDMTNVKYRVDYLIEILRMMTEINCSEPLAEPLDKNSAFPPKFSDN
jgi:Lon protease-like protein